MYDLRGKRFGRLVVLSKNGRSSRGHGALWLCKCDCGNLHRTHTTDLRHGYTRSCGCLQRETASAIGKVYGRANWERRCAGQALPPRAVPRAYDASLSNARMRFWARELARVAAHEGEPARENFRRRAWLNPHLAPALPTETGQVAA